MLRTYSWNRAPITSNTTCAAHSSEIFHCEVERLPSSETTNSSLFRAVKVKYISAQSTVQEELLVQLT